MPSNAAYLEAVTQRRSVYTLSPESTISDAELNTILETALEQAPSTFGSFTTRLHVVLKEEHFKLWDIVDEVVRGIMPAEAYEAHTKSRIEGFRNAYGTILFFEDPENTRSLQEKFPNFKDHFPTWSQHTSAIHQYIIWTALANSGLGANLQHYNPIIDQKVQDQWNIPADWTLTAQLVFGKPTAPAGPKPTGMKKPLNERLFIHGG